MVYLGMVAWTGVLGAAWTGVQGPGAAWTGVQGPGAGTGTMTSDDRDHDQ